MVTGVTAVVAALDPVLTRYDRQDVIEPFALCVSLLTLHAAWHLRDRGALAYVSVTGLLGGLALLTNEITICLIAVPPLFALLERNGPLVRRSAAALGIAVAFGGLFLLWAAQLGLAGSFVTVQTATLRRLVGLVQITGLNVPGVSLRRRPAPLGRTVLEQLHRARGRRSPRSPGAGAGPTPPPGTSSRRGSRPATPSAPTSWPSGP